MQQTSAQKQQHFYDTRFKKLATTEMEETLRDFYFQKLVAILSEHKPFLAGVTALEVGVGEGILMQKMMARFPQCQFSGIDISEKNIEKARAKGLTVSVGDADNLVMPQKYDLVFGTALLHHLDDIPGFFKSAAKLLKPGGALLFGAEPVFYEYFYILYHLLRGSWEIEKGMLKISVGAMQQALEPLYTNIRIYRHGNAFVYLSKSLGDIWNRYGLSRVPFLNDIYIYAEKKSF
ncbi:MAG: class I SAM-dependent methyltransferase [Candidatus Omnitrophica bacterium]|nr:class I SAM-dependent methyltransferase [Candidatus Omnitrophota bacterium]